MKKKFEKTWNFYRLILLFRKECSIIKCEIPKRKVLFLCPSN